MKFIKTDGWHYFNSDQILGFVIREHRNTSYVTYYTVNAIPVNYDSYKELTVINDFRNLKDAEKFLAELVAKLNAEEINHVET